jgi:hypothetical protein
LNAVGVVSVVGVPADSKWLILLFSFRHARPGIERISNKKAMNE